MHKIIVEVEEGIMSDALKKGLFDATQGQMRDVLRPLHWAVVADGIGAAGNMWVLKADDAVVAKTMAELVKIRAADAGLSGNVTVVDEATLTKNYAPGEHPAFNGGLLPKDLGDDDLGDDEDDSDDDYGDESDDDSDWDEADLTASAKVTKSQCSSCGKFKAKKENRPCKDCKEDAQSNVVKSVKKVLAELEKAKPFAIAKVTTIKSEKSKVAKDVDAFIAYRDTFGL